MPQVKDEAWFQVDSFYDTRYTPLQSEVERSAMARKVSLRQGEAVAPLEPDALDVDELDSRDQELPERFRIENGIALAWHILT